MNIYNHAIFPFAQFSSSDFQQVVAENGHKYAKIVIVALAIFAAAATIYYLIKVYEAAILGNPAPKDNQNIVSSPSLAIKTGAWKNRS